MKGVLLKSENLHALILLYDTYKNSIKSIYIDPPFNTGTNEFLYKNDYLDSSWISMIYDRILIGKDYLTEDGSFYFRIDYHGNYFVRLLLNNIFGKDNFQNELIVNRIRKNVTGQGKISIPVATDSIFLYFKTEKGNFLDIFKPIKEQRGEYWRRIDDSSGFRRPPERIFFGKTIFPPTNQRHFKFSQNKINAMIKEKRIRLRCKKCGYIHQDGMGDWGKGCSKCKEDQPIPEYLVKSTGSIVLDSDWTDIAGYSHNWDFPTENAEVLLERVIKSSTRAGDSVMDYFLGSGTTIAVATKMDRTWIGVEMGDHIDNIILPRIKKVIYEENASSGRNAVSQKYIIIKYQRLEQYEDTLNNIEFIDPNRTIQKTLERFSDYFISYMLDYETRDSPTRLSIEQFKTPFNYKMKTLSCGEVREESVDLVETFNYLLGLHVKKIRAYTDGDRIYRTVFGECDHEQVAVIWRDTPGLDLERDKRFIEETILAGSNPDTIYVNGDSYVKNAKPIEPKFRRLMCA